MITDRLYGWDFNTWLRAADWAGVELPNIYDEANWPALLSIHERWLLAGGPVSGPSGKLVLSA